MKNNIVCHLNINGFDTEAYFRRTTVEQLLLPILKKLSLLQAALGRRLVVYLAAPPGAGKSTLSAFLCKLSEEHEELTTVQTVGIDGFHRRNEDLKAAGLLEKKGAPETYDTDALKEKLELLQAYSEQEGRERTFRYRQEQEQEWNAYRGFLNRFIRKRINKREAEKLEKTRFDGPLLWPVYDRNAHEPQTEGGTEIREQILIIEGNWLLYEEEPWSSLQQYADYTVFIDAEERFVKNRLIERKVRGGRTRAEAEAFYENTDGPNVRLVLQHSAPAKLNLHLTADGDYKD